MGVDLSSLYKKNCWHFSWGGWTEVLKVAFENGWKPRGTEAPSWVEGDGTPTQLWVDSEEWSGSYFSNMGQYVTAEDTKNLSEALEWAMNDMPDCGLKDYIREFVVYCRDDEGFYIF